ncbi:MAG: helix-turn-helix transcriptional regulator [Paracoccaceae bacterium]
MTVVMDNSATGTPFRGLPPLEHEVDRGELRLTVLPPGRIDATIEMHRHLVDVNLNGVEHGFGIGTERRSRSTIAPDSIAYWPIGSFVSLEVVNTLPGCVLEVGHETMTRWFDAGDVPGSKRLPFRFYRHDPVAADLGRAAIRYLLSRRGGDAPAERLTLEALALGIAARTMALIDAQGGDPETAIVRWRRRIDDRRIARALDWAEGHLADPGLSVADMAAAAGLSPAHFGSVFKAAMGESAYAFILRRRAEAARDLIAGTRLPLVEIAYLAGFSSQAHMTTIVKRFFDATPGAIRSG